MKKLGVFIAYDPGSLEPGEGIARLIAFILEGAHKAGETSVTIAFPAWMRKDMAILLEDWDVPDGFVEILTTSAVPYIVRLANLRKRWRRRDDRPKRSAKELIDISVAAVAPLIVEWLASSSLWLFLLGLIAVGTLGTVLAIPAIIAAVLLGTLWGLRRLVRAGMTWSRLERIRRGFRYVIKSFASPDVLDRTRAREVGRLVRLANSRRDIGAWYVPSLYWPEIEKLRARTVVGAPDIVFYEHPTQFATGDFMHAHSRIVRSLHAADHLICYSEHVKLKHYVEQNNIEPDRISVIRHGNVDLARYSNDKHQALDVVHRYIAKNKEALPAYLQQFRFDDVPFLFYSSQDRPHKNIEGLIRGYEKVLRERYKPVKLVLTARIAGNPRIMDFVQSRGLQADVLSLPGIPTRVLAALYRLAQLSVNPSQFEGGFPFTFSEGCSVGTPSIMSRIPVVRELIDDPKLLELMTFEPWDIETMADKIVWGLENRSALLAAQAGLCRTFAARSWTQVAGEYLDVLRAVEKGTRPGATVAVKATAH